MTTQRALGGKPHGKLSGKPRSLFPARQATIEPDWQALYAEHLPRIYHFFCYRVSEGPTAEDLTSTTFEKAWRARHRYRQDIAAFTTWLYSIARNVANDYFRQAHPNVPLDDGIAASHEQSPDESLQQQEDFAQLSLLMASLPQRDREVLALKFGAALGHADIARVLGLSQGNVAVIAHRAVQQLRQMWPTDQEPSP